MKHLLTTLFILFMLTLAGASTVEMDGTLRGRASMGLLQLDVRNRRVKVAFAPYGLSSGGRVYYRLQAAAL